MERLTAKYDNGFLFALPPKNDEKALEEYVDKLSIKLGEYEDLEEKLEKVYGKCDGLLETAINSLVRHEGAEIGTPAKARLLTDEDVDKWESFKDAEEQGLILRLREPLTDDLRKELDKYVK